MNEGWTNNITIKMVIPFAEFNLQLLQGPRSFIFDDVMPLGWFFELKKLQYQHSLLYVFKVVSKATRK